MCSTCQSLGEEPCGIVCADSLGICFSIPLRIVNIVGAFESMAKDVLAITFLRSEFDGCRNFVFRNDLRFETDISLARSSATLITPALKFCNPLLASTSRTRNVCMFLRLKKAEEIEMCIVAAYADAFEAAGRKVEAREWFGKCAQIDSDESTDALDRSESS